METPVINVGIMTQKEISFLFNAEYVHVETGTFIQGAKQATWMNGKIIYAGKHYDELFFEPTSPEASFDLPAVTIGIDFHWQREETQRFKGALELLATADGILVINQVNAEEYLTSVISSEMNANASKEFLKAHAVISRSWLLAQSEKKFSPYRLVPYRNGFQDAHTLIRWYDREDHELFDVCADDHCQRYQGITRASNPTVHEAIEETRGEVLTHKGLICDTRFSKCCGGVTERFENCWESIPHPYLTGLRDDENTTDLPDLTDEREAEWWIRTSPTAFCNTNDKAILSQVLNNYDQETTDFYRWHVSYKQEELADLIHRKTGMDFGQILDLIPVERGSSGRIVRLKIVGTLLTFTIGKELEIRRTLSESHLYSSAFVVDKEDIREGIPQLFRLTGAGWGHGVGLCQIGAAVMGAKGYTYQQILSHYFPGSTIEKRY